MRVGSHKPVRAELVEALPFPFNPRMAFWTYILHCNGGYFYTGHTDDLERRMAEHQAGEVPGFVRDHGPARLVWSSDFATRYEALSAERQIKGWSRAKKLALIRGDWDHISMLAKGKGRASTSSARTGWGKADRLPNRLASVLLQPHPDFLSRAVSGIEVEVRHDADRLALRYLVTGRIEDVLLPAPALPERTEELWRHTCFEAFVAGRGDGYREFNLAPSGQWASYDFDSYRTGMRNADAASPTIVTVAESDRFVLDAALSPLHDWDRAGLSAIIEAVDGSKSYWALAHPPGKPDFHHPDCFALTLPAPGGA